MLIVDDDEDHRALLRGAMRHAAEGFEVDEAHSLDEGRALLANEHYDCALVDLHLPDGDGRDLIATAGTTPVVIVTSAGDVRLANDAINRGAQDFVVKGQLTGEWLRRTMQLAMERKRGELERARAEHEHRLAALGRLAGSVGHEINNPASVVTLGMDSITARLRRLPEGTPGQQDILETLDDCREAMDRIVKVIRNLVVVASPSLTRTGRDAFDLGSIVDSVCALTRTGHDVELRRDGDRLGLIRGRPSEVSQALMAVLDNAVKASPAGSTIVVHTRRSGDEAVIRIADEGPGIAQEHLPRIYEPFFTTRDVGEGSGLGLTVARGVVAEHDGSIEVAETGPAGTVIEIRLPV